MGHLTCAQSKASRLLLAAMLLVLLNLVGTAALTGQRVAVLPGPPPGKKVVSTLAASTIIAPVPAAGLMHTNGNKVVAGAGGLHAVFTDGNLVRYTKTSDGVTWTLPITIAANAQQPTIAIAGTTIGVAYVFSGQIKYVYKQQAGANWSSPFNVYSVGISREPAMVSYQSKMHLAWATDSTVAYVSFPANIAPPLNITQTSSILCIGYSSVMYQPAIAVSATSATNPQPLVRVAYFVRTTQFPGTSCGGVSTGFGYQVDEFNSVVLQPVRWVTSPLSGSPGTMSISMAANAVNGDFYLGVSYGNNGIDRTELWYENAWNATDPWRSFVVLPRKAHIDVEAACSRLRIAVSDFTLGVGGYGPTWYRTGTWTGASVSSPTWEEPVGVAVSGQGANPQALFLSAHSGTVINGTSHVISSVFDDQAGAVKHDDRSFRGPAIVTACPQLKLPVGPNASSS